MFLHEYGEGSNNNNLFFLNFYRFLGVGCKDRNCCGSASVSGYVSENAICQIRNMRIRHNIFLGSGLEIMVLLCYLETGTLDTGQSNFDFIL